MCLVFLILVSLVAKGIEGISFGQGIAVGNVDSKEITDASGLAASRTHQNVLYTHNDDGDAERVFAINATDASVIAVFGISGADNYDWEDIAVGPCPGNKSCMYILDAGESSSRKVNMVYMVPEPGALRDQTLTVAAKLPFKWSEIDGQTIMVDNHGEVYVASNVLGGKGLLAHLPSSGWGSATPVNATSSVHINITTRHHDPTSGDISSNGKELILRAKENVFYWSVANNDYLGAVTSPPVELPQHQEYVGEAICWDRTGTNYYTLSEGLFSTLYKFVRVPTGPAVG